MNRFEVLTVVPTFSPLISFGEDEDESVLERCKMGQQVILLIKRKKKKKDLKHSTLICVLFRHCFFHWCYPLLIPATSTFCSSLCSFHNKAILKIAFF